MADYNSNRQMNNFASVSEQATNTRLAVVSLETLDPVRMEMLLAESFEMWLLEIAPLAFSSHMGIYLFLGDGTCVAKRAPADRELPSLEELIPFMQSLASKEHITGQLLADRIVTHVMVYALGCGAQNRGGVFMGYAIDPDPAYSAEAIHALSLLYTSCLQRYLDRYRLSELLPDAQCMQRELQRQDALFEATRRLSNQIDVASLLEEFMHTVEVMHPLAKADLYLSQDHGRMDIRVKPLTFRNNENDLCTRAFLEGRTLVCVRGDLQEIAAPISGKQATYGVIHLTCSTEVWEASELPALEMLAATAGSAFENAKLYEQSNLLINELQMINELTKRLNQSLRLEQIFEFATNDLIEIFQADYCCVLQLDTESSQFIVMATNHGELQNAQFPQGYGFCGQIYDSREPLIISDYTREHPVTSRFMAMTGSRSLIASPIIANNEVLGAILVVHRQPNYFSYDNYKLLQVISTHFGLAITNASLHAEVRRMVITDNLTGLHARHYLDEKIQARQRTDGCGSLVLVDIDHFKKVNDTYGHQVGDEILMQVSRIVASCIRDSDIAARWGGEELAVYLPKVRSEQGYRIAERIRARVAAETQPTVTVSCGVSEWTFEDEKVSVETLFYRADMSLYAAKNNGRNKVAVG